MLERNVTCRLVVATLLCTLQWVAVTSPTPGVRLRPKGIIHAPMNVNHTVVLHCEVSRETEPRWSINGHSIYPEEHNNTIHINNTNCSSVLRIGDMGMDAFGTVHGSALLNIECTAVRTTGFRKIDSKSRRVVRFETPGQPSNITVFASSGRDQLHMVQWERPENMIEQVRFIYTVIIEDLTNPDRDRKFENVTEQRIRAKIPDCFNITVWGSNKAGAGEPKSFLPSSPSCNVGGTTESPETPTVSQSTAGENEASNTTEETSGSLSSTACSGSLVKLAAELFVLNLVINNYI